VRRSIVATGILVVAWPLVVWHPSAQELSKGALGPVNALGQEFRLPPASTAPAPRLPDGTIDLGDGIWVNVKPYTVLAAAEGLLLPAAKAIMASRTQADDGNNWCLSMGIGRYTPYPFRFIQNYTHKRPTHLFIFYELMRSIRQVFMDGRTHPPDLDPSWLGHSIGWYEKDTLVIDTVGFNDKAWIDGRLTPHTDQLHTVERWTRVDRGHLATEMVLDDPGTFSRPVTVTYESTLRPPGDEIMEYVCAENNQYGFAGGAR